MLSSYPNRLVSNAHNDPTRIFHFAGCVTELVPLLPSSLPIGLLGDPGGAPDRAGGCKACVFSVLCSLSIVHSAVFFSRGPISPTPLNNLRCGGQFRLPGTDHGGPSDS